MAGKMQKLYAEIEEHALKIEHLRVKIRFLNTDDLDTDSDELAESISGMDMWCALLVVFLFFLLFFLISDL